MSVFDRFKKREVEVPRIDVQGGEATVHPGTGSGGEERDPQETEPADRRKFKLPGKIWS